jgi:hypothetical protein
MLRLYSLISTCCIFIDLFSGGLFMDYLHLYLQRVGARHAVPLLLFRDPCWGDSLAMNILCGH